MSLFLDIQKAHNTIRRHGLLSKLNEVGLKGHIPLFIKLFLTDRTIHVMMSKNLSEKFAMKWVSNSGVLDYKSFIVVITINDLFSNISPNIKFAMHADDWPIDYRRRSLEAAWNNVSNTRQHFRWSCIWSLKLLVLKSN